MDYPRIRAAPTGAGIKLMPGAEKGLVKFSFFPDLFPFLTIPQIFIFDRLYPYIGDLYEFSAWRYRFSG
jgi:hypothetical protein